ncbi:MAG: hypothetical protein AMJ43_06565 [Coxiella sp. DG_40]|nr:MAG: hypothetical protein AMJ43_06565 [Coxiella sp. DG_40]
MITLMARQIQMPGKLTAAVLFTLLFCLAQGAVIGEQFNGDIRRQTGAFEELSGKGIMVNNLWVDVPLTQVFRDISIETGVVIALCPHVPDPLISLDAASGKTLQECLRELVAGRGLFIYPKSERFYLVSCGDPSCPSFLEIANSKRLYLKYITARHLVSSLPRSVQQYVSSGERPNEVLVYTVPEIMNRIMEIVARLDIPQPQVVLEVLVVELQEEASEEFGLDWEYSDRHNVLSMERGLAAFTGIARYTSVPAREFTSLLMTLRALVGEKKASIRSRPRVATLNGQKAAIEISLDEYFTIVTDLYGTAGTLRTELEVIKSGVLLNITPQIGDDGDITVDVLTEVSDVTSRQNQIEGNVSGDLPIIRRRKAETCVRVKEGDAIVIGGLIETQERSNDRRVPLLSSIPLVGGIFESKESITVKKEVVIFITPRLMEDGEVALSNSADSLNSSEELDNLWETVTPLDNNLQNREKSFSAEEEFEHVQEAVTPPETQHQDCRNSLSVEEELKCLQEIIALLDVQQPQQKSLDISDEGGISFSGRHVLLDVAEELEALRGVANLLDVQHQPVQNLLDIDKERKSLCMESPQ